MSQPEREVLITTSLFLNVIPRYNTQNLKTTSTKPLNIVHFMLPRFLKNTILVFHDTLFFKYVKSTSIIIINIYYNFYFFHF
jgi:hypothetical protein